MQQGNIDGNLINQLYTIDPLFTRTICGYPEYNPRG